MSRLCDERELREAVGSAEGVFVLFYAAWCPFSMAFLPVYEKHAAGREKEFVRIAIDGHEAFFDEHGVDVYPTVLFFRSGKVDRRLDGKHLVGLREKQLTELIASCRAARG